MKRLFALAVLAAGCSGNPPATKPSPAEPRNPPAHEVVAWLNGRPISRDELLDKTLEVDYRGTVDRYIYLLLVDQRKRDLGIGHTPQEMRDRARAWVDSLKSSAGPAVFEANLMRRGVTEAEFVESWAREKQLATLFGNEKAAVYELLNEGYARVEIAVFPTLDAADRYHEDPAAVEPREVLKNVRLSRSLYPTLLRHDLVEQIVSANPNDPDQRTVRASLATGAGAVHVTLHERIPGLGKPYAEVAAFVVQDILNRPPDTHELEMWVQHLYMKAEVKYDDRWYSPGN